MNKREAMRLAREIDESEYGENARLVRYGRGWIVTAQDPNARG